ncbi:MAG: ABC transporter permease, partial [Mogibacterium sp.]|nr:ABC transporter permease [Mogibacterium sp.]
NFRKDTEEDLNNDGTKDSDIRVYRYRDDINRYCLMSGKDAEKADEIVIDRMHADNNGIKVGDSITVGGEDFKVTGLVAFPNYSTLHKESTDMMFDALTFDVAMTTDEGWDRIKEDPDYEYAWLYENSPANVKEEKKLADNFMKALITQAAFNDNEIEDYTPEYANQAIQFAPADFGSDKAMGGVVLDILIIVLAFIFAVIETNTIAKEAPVIGTLRASGYSRRELTINYLAAPVIVTLMGALAGNILGYTYFKNVVVSMYYNSYSLPVYETVWTPDAFVRTTLIPVILMLLINWVIIRRRMKLSPLRFLRGELKTVRRKRAVKLPEIGFIRRFRLRIFLQNIPGYFMLFIGVFFVMVMLAMAVGMPDTLDYYKANAADMMIADYQVMLTSDHDEDGNKITTSNPDAEAFSSEDLVFDDGASEEDLSAYGVAPDSRYVKMSGKTGPGKVCVSSALVGKYGLTTGDTVKLKDKYGYGVYEPEVAGVVDYDGGIAVFMDNDSFNEMFDRDEGSYDGFFSDSEVTDINDDFVAAVITQDDILKMAAQLDHSMGAYMLYFQYLCVLLSAVLLFLLTKVIVERNEKSISMIKILGYTNGEVVRLYLVTTTIVVIISELITVFASKSAMAVIWKNMLARMSGYFPFVLRPAGMLKMCILVFAGYLIVMLVDFRRIRRIPMDEALKDME